MYLDSPDSLSVLLQKLELGAEVYVSGDFCGTWAVDTSGSKRIPFHLIGQGRAWLHFRQENPIALAAGHLVVFPHDDAHIVTDSMQQPPPGLVNAPQEPSDAPATSMICGFFEFRDKSALPLLDALPPAIVLCLNDLEQEPAMSKLIEMMIAELQSEQPGYYAIVDQLAYLLFVHILRQQMHSGAVQSGLLAALFDEKIGPAINAIHNAPGERWSLESLAQHCAMGRSAFSERFKKQVGMPAMQYLSHWRMQEATRLLRKTSLSLPQIAEQCGYESEAAFSKAFKKITGQNPGATRRAS